MIKIASILLTSVIVFQSIGISSNNIAQIDELIEHAKFHNEKYGDGVFSFLSKHYGNLKEEHGEQHEEEKSEHEQLPFQQQFQLNFLTAFILVSNKSELNAPESFESSPLHFFYNAVFSWAYIEGPLQPPRFL